MLTPGQRLGRYEVVDRIGHGGLASVYRVRHVDLGAIFALKLLEVQRPHLRERLLDEGRAQATLVHPNVARVSDVLVHEDMPVLVLEFVDGPSLDRYLIQHGRIDLSTARHLAVGITRGLRAAHAHGLVHRDLKPGNILLASTPGGLLPKLADFGLVKVLHDDLRTMRTPTRSGVAMGTPEYMAPEQIRDAATVDHRADLYSLGCVLYLLLTGTLPYTGPDLLRLYEQIAAGTLLAPSERVAGIPPILDKLVLRLLRADPRARPASCDEVLAALEAPEARVPMGPTSAHPGELIAAAQQTGIAWTRVHGPIPELRRPSAGRASRAALLLPFLVPTALAAAGVLLLAPAPPDPVGPRPAGLRDPPAMAAAPHVLGHPAGEEELGTRAGPGTLSERRGSASATHGRPGSRTERRASATTPDASSGAIDGSALESGAGESTPGRPGSAARAPGRAAGSTASAAEGPPASDDANPARHAGAGASRAVRGAPAADPDDAGDDPLGRALGRDPERDASREAAAGAIGAAPFAGPGSLEPPGAASPGAPTASAPDPEGRPGPLAAEVPPSPDLGLGAGPADSSSRSTRSGASPEQAGGPDRPGEGASAPAAVGSAGEDPVPSDVSPVAALETRAGPPPVPPLAPLPPAPEPRPPTTSVAFEGDASRVWLVRDGRRRDLPGEIGPGEYEVVALFPGTGPVPAGRVLVGTESITLRCSSFAMRCQQ